MPNYDPETNTQLAIISAQTTASQALKEIENLKLAITKTDVENNRIWTEVLRFKKELTDQATRLDNIKTQLSDIKRDKGQWKNPLAWLWKKK